MVQAAFRDHWGHVDVPFEEELKQWQHWTTAYKDFDPSLWFLAVDGSTDEIVGVVLGWPTTPEDPEMGWIEIVGVLREWRCFSIWRGAPVGSDFPGRSRIMT